MIILDKQTKEKLKLIDSILDELSIETIKEEFGLDLTAMKLRGEVNGPPGIIQQLIDENNNLRAQMTVEQSNLIMVKGDIATLLQCIKRGISDAYVASEFTSLAQRYGVY